MATGIALPKKYLWKEWKSLLALLIPVMSWMWVISGACVWWLMPSLNFVSHPLYNIYVWETIKPAYKILLKQLLVYGYS